MARILPAVRRVDAADRAWIRSLIVERWGAEAVVSRGAVHHPERLEGFVAELNGAAAGLVTYRIDGGECELMTLDSLEEGRGVGSALLASVRREAENSGCRRLWLITTNDNLRALGFYQKRGMRLVAVHPNALARSRELKPSIPLVGEHGIPLRDEIELEMELRGSADDRRKR